MDEISWWGIVGFLISGFILLVGIRRARTHAAAQYSMASRSTDPENPQPAATPRDGAYSYIEALQTGDPDQIARAHLPDLLTPELLFQGLNDLRGHTSALDMFIERMRQQFVLHQYGQLTRSWVQYIERMGISQDVFWRQVTDRFLVPLQQQKGASGLQADIAEQKLREAQARHAQNELDRPTSEREKPKTDDELIAQWKREAQEEVNRLKATELFDDSSYEVKSVWTNYEAKVRDLRDRRSKQEGHPGG